MESIRATSRAVSCEKDFIEKKKTDKKMILFIV